MRINRVTYGKLKTPLKVNGNLKAIRSLLLTQRRSLKRLSEVSRFYLASESSLELFYRNALRGTR